MLPIVTAPVTHEQALQLTEYIFAQPDPRQTMTDIFDLIDWRALAAHRACDCSPAKVVSGG
jgi:hypothetical protein